MIYFDTCALIKLVRQDADSVALSGFIDERPGTRWFASEVARAEIARTVRRINHDEKGKVADQARLEAELRHAESLCGNLDLVPVSTQVLSDAAAIRQPFLRTLDAIHLATAVAIRTGLSAFVTYDKRLAAAAEDAGLPVASPG
ncbi:MAG: type II toxin-antitoxin system VapC family toxin [Nocardiopsaceae bacterium]|nr:type II toxin-antitoxin system VapC family toxin [Nocardiopsaceae bacterium]